MRNPIPHILVTLWLVVAFAPGARAEQASESAQPSGAVAVVEALHTVLIDAMQHAHELGYEGRFARLQPVVSSSLDLAFMAEKSAGSHWRKFSEDEKSRWTSAVSAHTVANYAGRFNGYSGQRFETHGEEPASHDTVLVRTTLHNPKDEDVQLNYRLRNVGGDWRIIDVYTYGTVSELALRRAEYSSAIARDGLDAVIDKLNRQVSEFSPDDS